MIPTTKYAKNGNINIAYQVAGDGPVDLIYVHGWVSNIDMMWLDPKITYCLNKLAGFARLIIFDKRGTGLSDRVNPTCTLNERMDDILSVMNAAGSKKAVFFGHSEGGTISTLFAATYPERTISLINIGTFAKRTYSPDYPWAPTPEERQGFYDSITNGWGNGQKMDLQVIMPSAADDGDYYNWFASYLRSAASPGAALALAKMNAESNIVDILDTIKVPTLILHRTNDLDVSVDEARWIADQIPDAKFKALEGNDHCFWVGDSFSVMAEVEEFVTGKKPVNDEVHNISTGTGSSRADMEENMLSNFKFNLKLEDYAKLCNRSLSSFKRDFSKHFGTTPSKWLKNKRLDYAKTLLKDTDLNVNQIVFECGFQNNSHFIKSFKELYHTTPHKYRSASQKG